ncbi:MAG: hypothetical protein J5644_08600 [Bacteroidales bacterium]|nr:hypothetical protein [Bacteroidales bacterium]
MKRIILTAAIVCIASWTFGQAIDTARFRLNFNPQLSNIQKINQQAVLNDTIKETVKFDYSITPMQMDVSFSPTPIKASKLSPEIGEPVARNYIKVGFGYPVTPLLEFAAHNANNSKYSYGINLHHFSSWAGPIGKKQKQYAYAPTSDTRVHLFLTTFFKDQTLYSSVDYNHELAHFYGYGKDVTNARGIYSESLYGKDYYNAIRNDFHHVKAEIGIRSNHLPGVKKLKQDVRLNYNFLYCHNKSMENHVGITSFFAYDSRFMKISGSQNYRIDFNFDYYDDRLRTTSGTADDETFPAQFYHANAFKFEIVPNMQFTIKEYHIKLGVGVPVLRSNLVTRCPVYPVAEVQLGIVPGILSIYAGVDGKAEYQGMKELLYENPYYSPTYTNFDTLDFTRTRINVYGGIKGNLVKKLNYHISARYAYVQDMAFFQLDPNYLLRNKFMVIYNDVNYLNVCLNLSWDVIDHLSLTFEGNYNAYFFKKDSELKYAWYKPGLDFGFDGKYTLKGKYIFDLNFKLEFMRWALSPRDEKGNIRYDNFGDVSYQPTKMKPVLDFGIGFEYLINKNFSAFATINNIGCQYYARYYDFNCFGINALVGVTYSFGKK